MPSNAHAGQRDCADAGQRIEVGGVAAVGVSQGERHGVWQMRDRDQMDVVCHQAVAQQGELVEASVLLKEVEIDEMVAVGVETTRRALPRWVI